MRENKFRAWDKEKEVMVYSCYTFPLSKYKFEIDVMYDYGLILTKLINRANITYDDDGEEGIINEFKKVDAIIMQYTGLRDKKGTRIYEGDIVEYKSKFTRFIGKIVYGLYNDTSQTDLGYYIQWFDNDYIRIDLGYWKHKGIEVIGNVYGNPTLLEGDR